MLNRKHSIVMLDGIEMVGLLNLGELEEGKININFTAKARGKISLFFNPKEV